MCLEAMKPFKKQLGVARALWIVIGYPFEGPVHGAKSLVKALQKDLVPFWAISPMACAGLCSRSALRMTAYVLAIGVLLVLPLFVKIILEEHGNPSATWCSSRFLLIMLMLEIEEVIDMTNVKDLRMDDSTIKRRRYLHSQKRMQTVLKLLT